MSSNEHQHFSNTRRVGLGSVVLVLGMVIALLVMLPATALGQTTAPTAPAAQPATQPTTAPQPSLKLSDDKAAVGTQITANGTGFQGGETVDVTFNGQGVGSPTVNTGGTWSLSFNVPNFAPGDYGLLAKGRGSNLTASASFTIEEGPAAIAFNPTQAAPGTSLTVTGTGWRPGESVSLSFNGPTVGTSTADTQGNVTWTFTIPATLSAGQFGVTATGETSGSVVNSTYTLIAGPTPVATAVATAQPSVVPTATPVPAQQAQPAQQQPVGNAPAMVHDERYFSQTGYRIDDDTVWSFFNQYGGIETFGYPTSRMMTFIGCPVQMFQRLIIQVCQGQGAALINMLDPEIFPYTNVNGSTFPAADPTLKNNTPQVSSPSYSTDITNFVQQNVPDTFGGQPVNFLQHFNSTGGLTTWGAPISQPAPDPANGNFIYQRFQRGIMHYIAGTGTESVLLADYLKSILMGQNVPADLQAQSQESRYFGQYCPGNTAWLCRPNDLPGTDLTFAFVQG